MFSLSYSQYIVAFVVFFLSSSILKVTGWPTPAMSTIAKKIFSCTHSAATRAIFGTEQVTLKSHFYDLTDLDMDGRQVSMSSFRGDVLLIINVACKCGLTHDNYTQLPKLVEEYGSRGFKVLAFPCNQFMSQEPGSHDDILNFSDKYDARDKIIWFQKGHVNGKDTREVYSFLKRELPSDDGSTDIPWNFAKFLVDHEGKPVKRFSPMVHPVALKDDIEALLKKKESSIVAEASS